VAEAFEAEVKITTDEAVRNLRDLEKELGGVSEGMSGASSSGSNFAQNLTAAVVTVQAAFAAISKLVETVRAAADEFERQSGILNRFNGDVSEAARRTNGLVSQLDLMAAQNRVAASGLQLTGEQFATLSVRASEMAAATGGDATEGINRLMQAIATGRTGALREYGVDLEGITDMTEKQEEAIRQLTEGYEDAESSADTFGGMLAVLETRMEDAKTEMIAAANDSGLLEQAMDSLSGATAAFTDELSEMDSGLTLSQEIAISGAAAFAAFAEQVEYYAQVMAAIDWSGDLDNMAAAAQRIQAIQDPGSMTDRIAALTIEGRNAVANQSSTGPGMLARDDSPARTRRRSSGRRNEPDTVEGPATELKLKEELLQAIAEQEAAEQRLLENQSAKAQAAADIAKAERERVELMIQQTEEAKKQKQLAMEAIEAERERQATLRRARRVQDGVMQGVEGIAEVTKKTIELSKEGGMSTKEAFKTAVDEWLKQLAIQEAWKGAAATVEAIGLAITNPPAAGTKVAEAAGHFAIAAAAGGASAAIPNAASPSGGGEATRPTAVGGNDGGGGNGGTVVVNYNAPTAEAQIGRMQGRAEKAAGRRFGT
jgi:chromosome segregation ATPase